MELKDILGTFVYSGAGCLFYNVDKKGDVWVLLGKRCRGHLFTSPFHWSIPEGPIVTEDASMLDAAMRIGYDETGILDDKNKAELFWEINECGIEMSLYSLRLSSKVPPKSSKSYSELQWFRVGDRIEDIDVLTASQLNMFSNELKTKRRAG